MGLNINYFKGDGYLKNCKFPSELVSVCLNELVATDPLTFDPFMFRFLLETLIDFVFRNDCQLGEKRVYQKLKKESVCYNGREHKSQQNAATCECTKYDYKCDFGYKRSKGIISNEFLRWLFF